MTKISVKQKHHDMHKKNGEGANDNAPRNQGFGSKTRCRPWFIFYSTWGHYHLPPPPIFLVHIMVFLFYTDFSHFLVFFHQTFYVTYFYNVDEVFLGTFVKKKLFFGSKSKFFWISFEKNSLFVTLLGFNCYYQ